MNLSERILLHLTGSMGEWNLRNADAYPQVGLWRELGHALGLPVEELENEVLNNENVFWMKWPVKKALEARSQSQDCSHPVECIGKVHESDTPHCLWCGDLKDLSFVLESLGKVYCHVTGGHISKPMTLPEVVIAVADDHAQKFVDEAVKDALEADTERQAAQAERDVLAAKLDAIQPSLEKFYKDHYPTIAGRAEILKIEGNTGGEAVWNRVATDLFILRNNTR